MLRYLPGIVLVQLVTLAFFWANQTGSTQELLLRVVLPSALFAFVTAFWFSALSRTQAEKQLGKLRQAHSEDREKLQREMERSRSDVLQKASADRAKIMERAHVEREKLVKKTHKEVLRNERSASRRASLKVGLAFAAVAALGVVMLISELLTLGLMTLTTAGGALGGYLLRWRQSHRVAGSLAENADVALPAPDKVAANDTAESGGQKALPDLSGTRTLNSDLDAEPGRQTGRSRFFNWHRSG
jgi:hypothetical protein